jgi:D-glycero-alpha-D-manno-heptose-7-phosphate kinase
MIVRARAPLRLGLAGGGTDLSPYCDEFGGAVLNCTIGRYAYANITPSADGRVHLIARDLNLDESFDAADLDAMMSARLRIHGGVAARMALQFCGGHLPPITVETAVDAPAGSGLGSSSALCVALVEAFVAKLSLPLGPYDVAHLAFEIERLDLSLAGGKQDHYAAAFGGLNFIEFLSGDRVIVNPLRVARGVLLELEASLVTCFTGISRSSDDIIRQQLSGMTSHAGEAMLSLHQLKSDAVEMKQALLRGEIGAMAAVLNRSWTAKKRTASGISNERIESLRGCALAAGAVGGKVSGAGGGGFMMFLVAPPRRIEVVQALRARGAEVSFPVLTHDGAESWTGSQPNDLGTRRPLTGA